MNQVKNLFNTRLKTLRNEAQITQQELAKLLNISKQTVSNYESGSREPSIDILISISTYFNVSVDYLIGVSETKNHGLTSVNSKLEQLNAVMEKYSNVKDTERNVIELLSTLLDLILRHTPDKDRLLHHYIEVLNLIDQHDLYLSNIDSLSQVESLGDSTIPLSIDEENLKSLYAIERILRPNLDISKKELDTTRKIAELLLQINQTYILIRVRNSISPRFTLPAKDWKRVYDYLQETRGKYIPNNR